MENRLLNGRNDMRIAHIALWVDNLEEMRKFYLTYFDVTCSPKYTNPIKKFSSYFISFKNEGCSIELMNKPDIAENNESRGNRKGWAHLAISIGSREKVDEMTERFRLDGFKIEGEPRITGDGFYESVILDPEGNFIEITE